MRLSSSGDKQRCLRSLEWSPNLAGSPMSRFALSRAQFDVYGINVKAYDTFNSSPADLEEYAACLVIQTQNSTV